MANNCVTLRQAGRADAPLIARLHAISWRNAYAAILDTGWLADELDTDRLTVWSARLAAPSPAMHLLIAERDGEAMGFVCVVGGADPRWGTLVDNLHVLPDAKGSGVGALLLRAAARWAADAFPQDGVHLFCYTENRPARTFYERMGGRVVEEMDRMAPDGRMAPEVRYHWPDAAALAGIRSSGPA
ncbi:GNAT family N-acetyltransferase [Sphingobium aromaticiconvertens]|uniref:GNAT family N-acetyltransferase n=1 Tax=Sphingobium aromaticiconvertens TaxID=365341 RepID=UPI003019A96A